MQRLARLTLVFAILFAFFFLLPPFLSGQLGRYPLMKIQDVFDLFTPLVLIPIYWMLFEIEPDRSPGRWGLIAFLIIAALWAEGQGMHLSANSIDNLIEGKAAPQVAEAVNSLGAALAPTGIPDLTYFYDEVLSHYLWHGAVMAFAALLLWSQWRNLATAPVSGSGFPIAGGIIHGITFALITLEGQTTPLAIPFAGVMTLVILIWGLGRLRRGPILLFSLIAFGLAFLLFVAWWLAFGCLVEPLDALKAVSQGLRPLCP